MSPRNIQSGVFGNDLSDHCAIAVVRNTKLPKMKPHILLKRDLKHFHEQAFLHDLSYSEWKRVSLIDDVELAWNFFDVEFLKLINKHAPIRKYIGLRGGITLGFSLKLETSLKKGIMPGQEHRKPKWRLTGLFSISSTTNVSP